MNYCRIEIPVLLFILILLLLLDSVTCIDEVVSGGFDVACTLESVVGIFHTVPLTRIINALLVSTFR